jgi:hypothetical protein
MLDYSEHGSQANFRFLIWTALFVLIGGLPLSFWTGDWEPYCNFLKILAGVLTILYAYAALVWTVGHGLAALLSLARRAWFPREASGPKNRPGSV